MDAAVHDAMIEGAVEAADRGVFCDSPGFKVRVVTGSTSQNWVGWGSVVGVGNSR